MLETTANAILAPNNKQDVVLMIQLLNSILQVPPASNGNAPNTFASCCILHLLGNLYYHLLDVYMYPSLSLHEQLTHLSAAAHLILTLYSQFKGDFIPNQLYFDVILMIKKMCTFVLQRHRLTIPKENSGSSLLVLTAWRRFSASSHND